MTSLTPEEKKFLDDAVAEAERATGKKLNLPTRHIVLNRARVQIQAARYAAKKQLERDDERQESEYSWSKPQPFRR
ncbi:hypothetical protein RHD99_13935 [Buttiauxella selenatireducens]|uniref:Uncharacterized protein n=1 Tax=Buttiauxella selenatireducens TaxID=3073902 RepID=A0ABY9S511_9ENTR|nr:hypothetical protein [Buttiauxella sp. R73]WMY72580.1 hypothetical protein RHD99_13935 [Buttiauxella sp. R73]